MSLTRHWFAAPGCSLRRTMSWKFSSMGVAVYSLAPPQVGISTLGAGHFARSCRGCLFKKAMILATTL
jgi:hypothetical protein